MTIDNFNSLEIVVGQIKEAERVKGSEKLLRLIIDIGDEERQILSGIAKNYSEEEVKEKKVMVVANLEPRELFGYESQGMILAADTEDGPSVIFIEGKIANGSKIR